MAHFVKKPCTHCPYRKDVKPFLHPERGIQLAYHTNNPYNTFPCHKTTVFDEDSDEGEMLVTEKSKECAGFITLQMVNGKKAPMGFEPSYDIVYDDILDMIEKYATNE